MWGALLGNFLGGGGGTAIAQPAPAPAASAPDAASLGMLAFGAGLLAGVLLERRRR